VDAAIPALVHVPAKPVKSTFFAVLLAKTKNESVYVPPVNLNDMALASFELPGVTPVATEPVVVTMMTGVPETVCVALAVKTVPVLFKEIVLVPKFKFMVELVIVNVWIVTLLSTVAMPEPEFELKVAVSVDPGADAPAAPPEVIDQF
jgi:hypothetical protein